MLNLFNLSGNVRGGVSDFGNTQFARGKIVKGLKGSIQGSVRQKSGLEYLSSRYIKIHMNPSRTCFIYLFIYSRSQMKHLKVSLPFAHWLWPAWKQVKFGLIKSLYRTVCLCCMRNSAGGRTAAAALLVPDDAAQTCQAGEHA